VRRIAVAWMLAGALLGGCGDDGDDGDDGSRPGTTVEPATTAEPDEGAIALRGDGLGVADLGDRPDDAVAAVTGALGEPTTDSGWDPPAGAFATCPGDRVRSVEWGGLTLLFADGASEVGDGQHWFAWRVVGAPPAVGTSTGLGFGATAADAEELHPDAVERVPAEPPFPPLLVIDAEGGPITAFLDATDTITNLEAGAPCGE
jgi:hypothetical protein